MTAPLLATRDALAIGLHAVTCEYGRMAYTAVCEAEHRAQADALLASGVIRDSATLADLIYAAFDATEGVHPELRAGAVSEHVDAALATALTEEPS